VLRIRAMSKRIKIKQDKKNFNKHTSQGMELLEKSIEKVGVIESVTVSNDDVIISGNARQEKIDKVLGEVEPIVIETDGKAPIILKRTDINSGTKEFYTAALLANTVSTKNINLDRNLIQEIAVEEFGIEVEELGVEVSDYSMLDELEENPFREQIKNSEQTQITFVFPKEHRVVVETYLKNFGKKVLQQEILKIMQDA